MVSSERLNHISMVILAADLGYRGCPYYCSCYGVVELMEDLLCPSLFQVMDNEIESKLKDAVEFYQQSDYVACRELLGRVLTIDQKNYNALVLNGSCCDHLGLENIGADYFYRAIKLQPDTVSAWQVVLAFSIFTVVSSPSSFVCPTVRDLLSHLITSPEFAEKKTTCGRFLIELLIRYRLELPDGLCNLRELCRAVLKSAPSDSFALELSIRLKSEMFLVTGLPRLVSPTLLNSPLEDNGFTEVVNELLSTETSTQLEDLADSMKRPDEVSSQTTAATIQLGTMVVAACRLLSESNGHARVGWQSLLEQIDKVELNGCRGLLSWLQQGYMDLHVTCLHALVAYRLHLFDHCEMVLGKILTYCSQKKTTAAEEARLLSFFPATHLSQCHRSSTLRPMCIPVRLLPSDLPLDLSETSRSTYGLVEEWATGLRLANAAASEQVFFASQLALELAPLCDEAHRSTFVWPNVLQTLLAECFLTGRCLKHAFHVLCSVEWDALNVHALRALVSDNSYQSAVRLRLCSLWAATEFMLQSNTLHNQAQLVLAQFADSAHNVAGSLQSLCSARDHLLLARLFSLLDLASGGCLPGVSKMVQLENYEIGIAVDEAYYANHLFLGKLRREAGNVEFGQACRRLGDFELAVEHIAVGLDCAHSQGQVKSASQEVVLLALQELTEINLSLARAYLRKGLLGSAIEKFQSVVKYLDQAFEMCSSLRQPPLWVYHYATSAFSLFNGIDDVDFRADLPRRFVLILHTLIEQPVTNHDKMCLYAGLQLAGLYLTCAYQRCLSTPKSRTTINRPESSVFVRARLLISLGLHFLHHSNYLRKHTESLKQSTTTVPNANLLFRMAESALKCALSVLLEKAEKDRHLLNALQSGEVVVEVSMLTEVEASPWDFVLKRLAVNSTLRAKAWYGLAFLYSIVRDDLNELVNYCLCQALLSKPDTTEAGVSLALRMLHLGRTQVPLALYLTDNLFPLLIDAVSRPVYGESNTTPSDHSKETCTFLRLAMEIVTEALNRALAYEPQNPRLWHNRGLLLQLAGLSAPAEFCLRRAYSLFAGHTSSAQSSLDLRLACSQCFLITCVR
ncbi:uncharacterized protein DEA37_0006498 [Paragonimus westermani]|uniref:Uncharacterized protein n=1 Tax=Paragonimus westermani TaxID=34504 RepID=A0A5J4P0K4_9TREM|nr:uncharacterized protein DEA37_0006498 [Paragonimus westermani]